jgi:hypothetical protein
MSNPALAVDALLAAPIRVGGVIVRAVSIAAYLLLERLQHPAVMEDSPTLSSFQWMELAFVLGEDPATVLQAHGDGPAAWEVAVLDHAQALPVKELPALRNAITQQLRAAFAPALPATDAEKKSPVSETPGTK